MTFRGIVAFNTHHYVTPYAAATCATRDQAVRGNTAGAMFGN